MKKLFVFDLDNTLRSTKYNKILPNTKKLILKIASNPNYILALATGRGLSKLDVLGNLAPFFKYKILVNGALMLKDQEVIDEHHIHPKTVEKILESAKHNQISVGMVGNDSEVVSKIDHHIEKAFDNFVHKKPNEDPNFYLNHKVYQMWVFHENEQVLEEEIIKLKDLDIYHWHAGGFDIVSKGVSKANALAKLKNKYTDYQVIAIGDGHNDLDMLGLADIGIIMENSRWQDQAQGKFQLIGPHVDLDLLYKFLEDNKII